MTEMFRWWQRRRLAGTLMLSAVLLACGIALLCLGRPHILDVLATGVVAVSWLIPVLLVVRWRARASGATRAELQQLQRVVVDKVEEIRVKQSRHEYYQELSLQRIEDGLRRLSALNPKESMQIAEPGVDVLFVTSNGAGLGHISRLTAIAKHLPAARSVEFLTMSTAYKQVAGSGITINYFPSSDAVGEPPATWNPIFRTYFHHLVQRVRPRVVVFDGTWVYTGITDVCRALGIPLVWVQRGMWKPDVDVASVQRHNAKSVADHVIVPGDFAGSEIVDVGRGLEPHYVGPILMTNREDLLPRDEACAALGLDPARQYVLLNLGGGAISDPDSIAHEALLLLQHFAPHLTPVQVVSPLAAKVEEVPGLTRISGYPVMPNARAFDVMIAAAGYNSVQEAVSLGVPTILVPNAETRTDDQVRRARGIASQGLCLVAETAQELRTAVEHMANGDRRQTQRDRMGVVEPPTGAAEAADVLEKIWEQASWPLRAETLDG